MSRPQLTPREYAYVSITGPGPHEAVTKRLGIEPDDAWNVGDIDSKNGLPRKWMAWKLRSGLDDTHAMTAHISNLLLFLRLKTAELRDLWVDHYIALQCVGHYPASAGSGMHFDREVIRQAAQLGLAIDCDHYFVDDHDHDA